jgi:hypothetical protein
MSVSSVSVASRREQHHHHICGGDTPPTGETERPHHSSYLSSDKRQPTQESTQRAQKKRVVSFHSVLVADEDTAGTVVAIYDAALQMAKICEDRNKSSEERPHESFLCVARLCGTVW